MIDIKRAAAAGEAFVRDLYAGETLAGLRVEEVERSGDGPSWTVTVGWLDPVNAKSLIPIERRIYRTLQVDATTGAVTSMRMRGARYLALAYAGVRAYNFSHVRAAAE